MAVKSKSKLSWCCGWKLYLVLTALCTLSYYLWHKIYYVLFHQRTDGWWYFELFWSKFTDKSIYTELSKAQFYKDLFHSIYNDLISCMAFLVQLVLQTGSLIASVVFTCVILSVITYIMYYLYSKKEQHADTKPEKKKKTNGRNKSKTLNSAHEPSQSVSLSQSRKMYQRWAYGLLFFAFLVSIPWEFVRLYQSVVAEKVAQMKAGIPAECVPEEMTFFQRLQSFLRKQISWSDDPCLVYHKALLVDPVWQVNPLMVVMSAFSHYVVQPAEILFGGLGKSFRLFFTEIPAQWQPFMLIVIVLILVLILIMLCGYRVHFPLLLKLEPKSPRYVRTRSRNISSNSGLNNLISSQETMDQSSLDAQSSLETQQ